MLQIDHRESYDVDIFLNDPQLLPFLNPITQEYRVAHTPDDYDVDAHRIRLIYRHIGEIDFICCADITHESTTSCAVAGVDIQLETPAEIIGKKIYYRGSRLQPRDMFDLAAVSAAMGEDYVINALRETGADECRAALAAAEGFDADAAYKIISSLMFREATQHLVTSAYGITIDLLRRASVGP